MREGHFIRKALLAAALLIICVTVHFMPFERAALAPDDYASLVRSQAGYGSLLDYPERPLNYLFLQAQSRLVGDNAGYGFAILLLSSAALLISVFVLLNELLKDAVSAFYAAVIFCLIPNTLEIYHTPIFANMNIVFSLYVAALILYLRYLDNGRPLLLVSSLVLYTVGVFWYEVGYFTPLIMLVAAFYRRRGRMLSWLVFLPVSALYLIYRMTGAFGLALRPGESHGASFAAVPFNLLEILHNYAGRYIARSVLYGLYLFKSIEMLWLVIIALLTVAIALFMVNLSRKEACRKAPPDIIILACAIFIFWLMPILFNAGGGVAGRHLVLPSVGVAVLGVLALNKIRRCREFVLCLAFIFFASVSQGNAWAQVVACRINSAVYRYLKENRDTIRRSPCVVIDAKSFADNIPYTFVNRDFNILNTYYGAQAFEEWGLKSMARLAAGQRHKTVYVSKTRLRISGGETQFDIPVYLGYRSEGSEQITLDQGCFIVDYGSVYAKGFKGGRPAI